MPEKTAPAPAANDNPYLQMYQDGMKQAAQPEAAPTVIDPSPSEMAGTIMKGIGKAGGNLFTGIGKGAVSTLHNIGQGEHALMPQALRNTSYGKDFEEGLDTMATAAQPHSRLQSLGKGAEQTAEYFLPGPAEAKLAEKLPMLGRFARPLSRMLGAEAVNQTQGGPTGAGAAGAGIGEGLAAGARAAAPALARTAMRIPSKEFAFGKTPGEAILNDTKGILPETVARSAQDTSDALLNRIQTNAANSPMLASLKPARGVISDASDKAVAQNTPTIHGQLQPLSDSLTRRFDTGAPIPEDVTPSDLLNLKRGFSKEHLGKWNPDIHSDTTGAGRKAYGALDAELDRTVPEAQDANQRVSSLIPVIRAGDKLSRAPGFLQRTGGRIAAHTGALMGAATLGTAGAHAGGLPGAIAGGLTGLMGPELLASPETQMLAARTLASPALQRGTAPISAAASSGLLKYLRDRKGDQ